MAIPIYAIQNFGGTFEVIDLSGTAVETFSGAQTILTFATVGTADFEIVGAGNATILCVAGGGAGNRHTSTSGGGGGGAGEVKQQNFTLKQGLYTATIGNSGAGTSGINNFGGQGTLSNIVGPDDPANIFIQSSGPTNAANTATGNNGGAKVGGAPGTTRGGGGGGSTGTGIAGNTSGNGGVGFTSSITGSSVVYGSGGGGANVLIAGGGTGYTGAGNGNGLAGAQNATTYGSGGGGSGVSIATSGNGKSGVVIISYIKIT